MSLDQHTITDSEKKKVRAFIDEAMNTFQEIDDRKGSLKDLAKAVAEELNIKPAELMQSARMTYKQSLEEAKEKMAIVEELMVIAGRA
jgi:hypothetical protein